MPDQTLPLSAKGRPASAAQQEKAKADALFASIGEGIIATDEQGKIIRVNQTALGILGYRKAELLDKWLPEVVVAIHADGTMIDGLEGPIAKALLAGKPVTEKLIYMNNEGATIPVSVTASPILLHGRPVGVIQIFRDISLEIQQDRLKTDFISLASHQLRTPLSSINLYSQMLHDGYAGRLSEEQSSFISTIINATGRMNGLINMLLNITRIEAGSIAVEPKPVRLDRLAEEIINEFTPEAKGKNIQLKLVLEEPPLQISTDALLVREVLANFLSNAIKYTPSGGRVTASVYAKGGNIIWSVKDTGYGIPLASQRSIFTKFFRADNILSHDVSGTGLGLYLTKTIIENLQGEVWFDSTENRGSTFYFSLPLKGSISKAGKFKIGS